MDFVPRLMGCGLVLLFALAIDTSADSNYDKELQEVKLYFYSPSMQQEQDVDSFQPPPEIDLSKQLKVILHGWNSDRFNSSITPIWKAYLEQGAHNFIAVDWSVIAKMKYSKSRELVQPVAERIGTSLSQFMQRVSIDPSRVHVIGHSLGAHVAGNLGRFFEGKLSRVTALDPAKPHFKLDSKDAVGPDTAQFVDVIHTDAQTLGEDIVRGHADFFPNSGMAPQPGCETLDIFTLHGCSHFRAPGFFAESIQFPNSFIACACSREEISRKDEICLPDVRETSMRECVPMGETLEPSVRGTFFLRTSSMPPYGLGYYTKSDNNV